MDQPVGEEVEGNQTTGCFLIKRQEPNKQSQLAFYQHESANVNVFAAGSEGAESVTLQVT